MAGGSPDRRTASAAGTQTVRVNSQQRWTDTGITVRAGDVITFNASGQIQMSDNAQRHGHAGRLDQPPHGA